MAFPAKAWSGSGDKRRKKSSKACVERSECVY